MRCLRRLRGVTDMIICREKASYAFDLLGLLCGSVSASDLDGDEVNYSLMIQGCLV